MAGFLRDTGLTAAGQAASDDCRNLCSHLVKNFLFFLALQFCPQSPQPLPRAVSTMEQNKRLETIVAGLPAIFRVCTATAPRAEICLWHAVLTGTACPTATNSDGASATDSAIGVARFPGSSSEIGFWLGDFAPGTRFLHLAGQTHSIEAALSLSVLHRKILFHVPLFAYIKICIYIGSSMYKWVSSKYQLGVQINLHLDTCNIRGSKGHFFFPRLLVAHMSTSKGHASRKVAYVRRLALRSRRRRTCFSYKTRRTQRPLRKEADTLDCNHGFVAASSLAASSLAASSLTFWLPACW